MKILYHTNDGMITGFSVNLPVDESRPYLLVDFDPEPEIAREFYIKDGQITSKGPRPTDRSQFDYATGIWFEPEFTQYEIDERAVLVRTDRDGRLAASDWTQVSDAPVDRAAWAAYRQALRDVPQQPGFPLSVTWPVPPV